MAQPTNAQRMNRPVWNPETINSVVGLTGGFDAVELSGYFVVVSNTGANNFYIGAEGAIPGILVAPGGTFETAVVPGSPFYISGTAGQPDNVLQYKEQ